MIDEENEITNGQTDESGASDETGTPDVVSELEQALAQAKDQLLRKAAEFDNYKKRMEAETGTVIRFANEDLLQRLLPVLDDFERSFKAVGRFQPGTDENATQTGETGSEIKSDAFFSGVELIYGKFRKILEGAGLTAFVSTGQPFNPELHDALLQVPRDDVPHHTVVEEIEKGYRLNEKVFRHARVVVSSKSDSTGS